MLHDLHEERHAIEVDELIHCSTSWTPRFQKRVYYLKEQDARGPEEAFLLGLEFAHLHPSPDGSLHLPLPEPLRSKAIASGWAEKHPLAGHPTVSRDIVMVYAPREPAEIEVVLTLVSASWRYARGH